MFRPVPARDGLPIHGVFSAVCFDRDGRVKWRDIARNMVVLQGRNFLLDTYFVGAGYTAAWYLGLIDGTTLPSIAATDTAASHPGWVENTAYVAGTRFTAAWGAASGGQKVTNAANFVMNANAAIAGLFVASSNVKGGATGILHAAALFDGGTRNYVNGDTLVSTYTASTN